MEIRDLYYIAALAVLALSGVFWVKDRIAEQMKHTALVRQDLENHKQNHKKLEKKVADHEDKIDDRLKEMNQKIDDNHQVITDKLTDIKVAIEQLKK